MLFALIPAAGQSSRMGRPKLALPLAGTTVLELVISTLRQAGAERVFVVLGPHGAELATRAEAAGADVLVLSSPTADMRATLDLGLRWVEEKLQPQPNDVWLLVPADHPVLDAETVRFIVKEFGEQNTRSIAIPTFEGRRGHPAVIAWKRVAGLHAFPPGLGLNAYLRELTDETLEVPVSSDSILIDLDTPEDYERLQTRISPSS
jgi:molybdenum cofactor cytidylyltransferase